MNDGKPELPEDCSGTLDITPTLQLAKEYDRSQELMMICIFSLESIKAMGGNRGKLAAQAGHAYLHAWWNADQRFRSYYGGLGGDHIAAPELYKDSNAAVKVCLICETTENLLTLYENYKDICGATLVKDAGRTVFNEPTITCVGIGPIKRADRGEDLTKLKVLI